MPVFEVELAELEAIDPGEASSADATRQRIHARMRAEASAASEQLANAVGALNPLDDSQATGLSDIYEALAPDVAALLPLFLGELNRLLRICESHPRSRSAFSALASLMFLESHASGSAQDAIRSRLVEGLHSSPVSVRRACADLLGGFGVERDATSRSELERCLEDPDWRIRALAESSLEGAGLLPPTYKPSLLDRLRRKSGDWRSYV